MPLDKATFESVEHPEAPRICQNDMLLAQFWMRQCTQEHDLCRQSELARLPLWVIDISNPVKPFIASGNNRHEPYVTLSYTWGSSRRSLLTSHNAAKLQSRLNIDDLPLTFSNAIEAAHELGFAFLWIDALCIRHDVQTELSDQIRRMADIFTGAALTILAGSGENPESGLVMPRDPRVTKPTRVRISVEAEDRKSSETYLIHFLAERRQVMWIEAPPSRRGWVLQEQVLSTRLLSFEKNGLFWRCNSLESDESEPMGWEIHKSTLAGAMCHFRLSLGNPRDLHFEPRITFQHWYFLISHYSRRSLLVLSDVLPALSGIASRFSESFRCNYLAGLWQEDIAVGLLWSTFFNDHERGIPATKMGCPSWSWTSSFPRYVHWPILSSGIMNEEGAQFIKCDISYPYLSGNQFGEVLEAPLTILAHARWTRLKLDQDSPKSMHGTLLADIGSYATGERIPGIQLDSLSGLSSGMPVLCVLCKCTGPSWPALHCIGVLPIAPGSTQYVRLGLVDEMEDSEYFGFSIDHHPDGSGREYVRKYKNYQPKIEIELV